MGSQQLEYVNYCICAVNTVGLTLTPTRRCRHTLMSMSSQLTKSSMNLGTDSDSVASIDDMIADCLHEVVEKCVFLNTVRYMHFRGDRNHTILCLSPCATVCKQAMVDDQSDHTGAMTSNYGPQTPQLQQQLQNPNQLSRHTGDILPVCVRRNVAFHAELHSAIRSFFVLSVSSVCFDFVWIDALISF